RNFRVCGSQGKYTLEVKQASTGSYSAYKIEWGDGKSNEYTGQKTMSHDYAQPGEYFLKFYGQSANGWETPVEYLVTAENTDIRLTLEGATTGTQCKGTEINLVLRDLRDNSASTVYEVDYGDNSGLMVYLSKDLTDEGNVLKLRHIYNEPSCGEEGSGYMISLKAQNVCGGISTPKYGPYRVAEQLKVRFDLPEKLCTEDELDLDAITSVEPMVCGNMDIRKNWLCDGEEVADGYVYFDKVGVYTFTASATMDGLDCGNDKITKRIRIIERIRAAVTPEQTEVCAGSSTTLDASASAGDEKKYEWSVVGGNASAVKFLPNGQTERVEAEFSGPGDYTVKVRVYNDCSSDEKTVRVHVKKDPEVLKLKEISPRCPEGSKWGTGTINMEGIVDYKWYNNQPDAKWTLTGPAGGWYEASTSNNPLKPIYVFTKPGQYELKVEIKSAGCGAPAEQLSQTWSVTINDPTVTPDITVVGGKTDLCEGEEARFRNNTTAVHASALNFEWTVRKNGTTARLGVDYQFVGGTNAKSKEPVLKFLTYGDYTVEVLAEVECNGEEREFHFHVKKAPEIVRFEIPQVECTPYVLLLRRMVDYNWFNDTKKQLTWTVEG
ncbi:MAG: PKD domain-containing protein, partial [Odoribacter sp.]|nr:PKD domain-containing protein [Odoribacter sp.]